MRDGNKYNYMSQPITEVATWEIYQPIMAFVNLPPSSRNPPTNKALLTIGFP